MIEANYCPLNKIERLEDFLKNELSLSKNQAKKYLSSQSLKSSFKAQSQIYIPIELLNYNLINPTYKGADVKVISDSDDFLVLSKPAGIHCHPLHYNESDNLISYIRSNMPKSYLSINEDSYDRGLLYRLDFETSGLIVYAKKQSHYDTIRKNFNSLVKRKEYFAKVQGEIKQDLELTNYLSSSGKKSHKIKVDDSKQPGSKLANISVSPVKYNGSNTIVKVSLNQGHRHQIRAQLASINHPIVGDVLYGGVEDKRLYLHCYLYEIENLVFKDEPSF